VIQQFIKRTDYSANSSSTSWNFKVTLIEPLSNEDQARYDWIIDLVGTYLETGDRSEIDGVLATCTDDGDFEARLKHGISTIGIRRGANETAKNTDEARMEHDEARMEQGGGANETRRGANETWERRDCNAERREWNALNSLNQLLKLLERPDLNSTNSIDSHSDPESPPEQFGSLDSVVVVEPYWDLSVLFARNPAIKASSQKLLLEQNASPKALVSWLIYAASPKGKGITRPAQFAASKLIGNTQAVAGNAYDRLAALPPKALYELIESALSGFEPESTVPQEGYADWQSVMANASKEQLLALKGQLYG
jgi:hypothetical protein